MKNKGAKSKELFMEQMLLKYNGEYTLVGDYVNNKTKTLFRHNVCGYEWETSPRSIYNMGTGCPKCKGGVRLTHEQYCKKVKDLFGDEYTIVGKYIRSHSKIKMRHNICGREFEQQPANFLTYKSCPLCAKEGTSKGEEKIQTYLEQRGFIYKREYRDKRCKDRRTLPFDFAIYINGEVKYLIEYDGEQHFKPKFSQTQKDLQILQLHDKIKTKFANNVGIELIRISYKNYDDIETILNNRLL